LIGSGFFVEAVAVIKMKAPEIEDPVLLPIPTDLGSNVLCSDLSITRPIGDLLKKSSPKVNV
jgi:hypothetical protein